MKANVGLADVAIIIAMKEEFKEFIKEIDYQAKREDGEYYYEFIYPQAQVGVPYRCVVTCVGGMNEAPAAVSTQKFINLYKPATTVIMGIAGGLSKDVRLGDVLVVTQVDAYLDSAKAKATEDQFKLSGSVYRCDWSIINTCNNLETAHKDAYQRWLSKCRKHLVDVPVQDRKKLIKLGEMRKQAAMIAEDVHLASGPIVCAKEEFVKWLLARDRHYKCVEMESAGFSHTNWRQVKPAQTIVIRCISDFGDKRKEELDNIDSGALRTYAMQNGKALLMALLEIGELAHTETKANPK